MLKRKGVILAGGKGTRLSPMTRAVSKHLLPVYNKPMIYYPLTILMLAGVRDILVITNPEDKSQFMSLLGNGSEWDAKIQYAEQGSPNGIAEAILIAEPFLEGSSSILVLGDTLLYGNGLGRKLLEFGKNDGAQVIGVEVSNPREFGIVELDANGNVISLEEKPSDPRSNIAIPGIYFLDNSAAEFARELKPSSRGELEITDVLKKYMELGKLSVEIMGRGTIWKDLGTVESLADGTALVRILENQLGFSIGDPYDAITRSEA